MKHITKTTILLFLSFSSVGLFAQLGTDDITIDTLPTRPETYKLQTHDPAIEIEYSTGKIYYGGEKGLYSSTDGGKTWTHYKFTVSGTDVGITSLEVNQKTGTIYAGYNYTGGYGSSTDGGKTWTIHSILSCTSISEIDGDIYWGSGALYKLTGGDYSTKTLASNGGNGAIKGPDGDLYSFKKSKGEIYQSKDKGKTWTLKHNSGDDIEFIYATDEDIFYGDEKAGTFKTDSSFSKPEKFMGYGTASVIDNGKGFLIITRFNGQLSFSDDNGKTFLHTNATSMKTIFGDIPVPTMDAEGVVDQLDAYQGKIYLADAKGLIYTMSLGGTNSILDKRNRQVVSYPNPAKEYINFETPLITGITVINNLGQEMEINLFNTQLDVSNYQSGIYFATILTPSGTMRSKFVVE